MNTDKRMTKRRLDQLYSPSSTPIASYFSPCKAFAASTKKKLNFSPQQSPLVNLTYQPTKFQPVDEDSCDSGFAEIFTKVARAVPTDLDNSIQESTNSADTANASMQSDISDSCSDRLIGDLSKEYTLPTMTKSKHNDLASITASTLADLLDGKYQQIENYKILDARYPYEYTGGHINCAESAYSKDLLFEKLFKQPLCDENGKPIVLIFHCEFSSERGPRLMREIRERDRALNKNNYPQLHYPEMYLLEGGYKSFFESFEHMCEPKSYVQMLDNNHREDLKFFRKKSKSLDTETKKQRKIITKLSF